MQYSGWPEPGELVVGKVTEVEDHGAYVDLVEYEEKQGLIHVSEVASGWVKYIRDYVREDQTVVCKVLEIDEESQQIDLSLKDVNDHQTSETIQEWKNEQQADQWLSRAIEDDDRFREIAETLIGAYGTLYEALEEAAIEGAPTLEEAGLDAETAERVAEAARENVSVPYVTVTGYVDLESDASDGVERVKEALQTIASSGDGDDDVEVDVEYVSAPEYRISAKAHDYKTAEQTVQARAETAIAAIEDAGGRGEYHAEARSADA